MYAVHRSTRSPSLAKDLLQEMTSLEAAEERARRGAGIPARHDFFEFQGNEPVPGMEYKSWNQLLATCGARCRRRGRVLHSSVNPAPVHQVIHEEILNALQRAQLRKDEYKKSNDAIVEIIIKEADAALARIRKTAKPHVKRESHE